MSVPGLSLVGMAHAAERALFGPLSLTVPAGEWTCLLGPSGVGKSTILRVFAGLETGVSFHGSVEATDGKPLTDRIALMAQSDTLMPWLSVLDNVAIGARLRGERADVARAKAMLDRVGLTDHIAKKPGKLSGGQRQRVALARTLMEDRPVVLLDEPFSAFDARTRSQMQDLACELLTGRTVLLVTHDPSEAVRVGQSIQILTETGLEAIKPPASATPRDVEDPETLQQAAHLLARLRQPLEVG